MKIKKLGTVLLSIIFIFCLIPVVNVPVKAKESSYTITYKTLADWKDAFNGQITITNTGANDIKDWVLEFDFDKTIKTFWTASIQSSNQNHYKITHNGWNNTIKPGESITLGFEGNTGNVNTQPQNYKLLFNDNEDQGSNTGGNQEDIQLPNDETGVYYNYTAVCKITSQWKGAYNAEVVITNTGKDVVENWEVIFDTNDNITNVWNGKINSHESDTYIIQNANWNQDIKPGKSVKFGFTANYGEEINLPVNFNMNKICAPIDKDMISVNYTTVKSWNGGFNGEIQITNNSSEIIEDWKLHFKFKSEISRFWDANIEFHENEDYFINNAGYNSDIKPGETLKLGFTGTNLSGEPNNISLFEMRLLDSKDTFIDSDNDGVSDYYEINTYHTDPNNPDTDNDGLSDYFEIYILGSDPLSKQTDGNSDVDNDSDGDGLSNLDEYKYGINPNNPDTDDDGLTDYEEINKYLTDPNNSDTDGDTLSDGDELILRLNPLKKDSDKNGIVDSKEIINQVIIEEFDEPENGIEQITVSLSGMGNLYYEISIYDMLGISDVSNTKGFVGIPMEVEITSEYSNSSITIQYNDKLLSKVKADNLLVVQYKEDESKYWVLESTLDKKSYSISAKVKDFGTFFLVDKSKISNTEIESKKINAVKKTKTTKKISISVLKEKLIKQVKKDPGIKGWKGSARTYTPEEAFDIIFKYDKEIGDAAKKLKVSKSIIQAILMREITCIYAADDVADAFVVQYYAYQMLLENYLNQPWYKQIFMQAPQIPIPYKEDSSTGLGQIFASTGIKASNFAIKNKIITGKTLDYSNWKERKQMWYALKDDNKCNVLAVGLVLKYEGRTSNNLVTDLTNPNATIAKKVLGKYNGNSAYGNLTYKYHKLFKQYN